ncbi:MAG: hypothetical protein JJE05_03825 [Actinobacteria bacterium]|nr:hypothetical protein [Actinomycetota bacterium]
MFEPCHTETLTWIDERPAAEVESCDWWFKYATGAESDATKDYGILWLQTTATPYKGFCVESFDAQLGADSQFEVIGSVEARRIRAGKAVGEDVALSSDADGHGPTPASVLKELTIRPGLMNVGDVASDGSIRAKWRSAHSSEKPISLVLGIEVAWDADATEALTAIYEIRVKTRLSYERC